jgi:hypothetical protein
MLKLKTHSGFHDFVNTQYWISGIVKYNTGIIYYSSQYILVQNGRFSILVFPVL